MDKKTITLDGKKWYEIKPLIGIESDMKMYMKSTGKVKYYSELTPESRPKSPLVFEDSYYKIEVDLDGDIKIIEKRDNSISSLGWKASLSILEKGIILMDATILVVAFAWILVVLTYKILRKN